MRATVRGVLRGLLLVAMLCGLGATLGMSTATASTVPAATSATPGVPTTTIKSVKGDTATVCVKNYGPGTTVTLLNQANGATGTIVTDAKGAGCTTIHLTRSCTQTLHETIVASGVDAKGVPASSSAIADVPPGGSGCSTASPTPSPTDNCTEDDQAKLSIYIVPQGAIVRGYACGFLPGETVDLFVFSTPHFVGTTTAAADGSARKQVAIPNCLAPGQHTFEFAGETSNHIATAQFNVTKSDACKTSVAAGGGGLGGAGGGGVGPTSVSNQGGGPTGGLAFTGADILAMIIAALVLLAIGIVTVASVRRRRTASAA